MTQTPPQLTEEERLEWEAEKYSERTLCVRVLSSSRVVICQPGLEIVQVWDPFDPNDWPSLYTALKKLSIVPLSEYLPPRQREQARTAPLFTDEEVAALFGTSASELKIDL